MVHPYSSSADVYPPLQHPGRQEHDTYGSSSDVMGGQSSLNPSFDHFNSSTFNLAQPLYRNSTANFAGNNLYGEKHSAFGDDAAGAGGPCVSMSRNQRAKGGGAAAGVKRGGTGTGNGGMFAGNRKRYWTIGAVLALIVIIGAVIGGVESSLLGCLQTGPRLADEVAPALDQEQNL